MEGDRVEPNLLLGYDCISIHSLRMEGDVFWNSLDLPS